MLTFVNGPLSTPVTKKDHTVGGMSAGFAGRVKEAAAEARAGEGVTQAEIAREIKVERATVSHWFSGRSEPTGGHLSALADFLGVRWQWLTEGKVPKRGGNGYVTTNYDAALEPLVKLMAQLPDDARKMLEQQARGYLALHGKLGDDVGAATMDIRKQAQEIITAWMALPENEREDFKRQLETASLRYRRHVPDAHLAHLARPDRQRSSSPVPSTARAASSSPAVAEGKTPKGAGKRKTPRSTQ